MTNTSRAEIREFYKKVRPKWPNRQNRIKSNQISLLAYNCNSYNIYQESKKILH